jgi:hypothetical protein
MSIPGVSSCLGSSFIIAGQLPMTSEETVDGSDTTRSASVKCDEELDARIYPVSAVRVGFCCVRI